MKLVTPSNSSSSVNTYPDGGGFLWGRSAPAGGDSALGAGVSSAQSSSPVPDGRKLQRVSFVRSTPNFHGMLMRGGAAGGLPGGAVPAADGPFSYVTSPSVSRAVEIRC